MYKELEELILFVQDQKGCPSEDSVPMIDNKLSSYAQLVRAERREILMMLLILLVLAVVLLTGLGLSVHRNRVLEEYTSTQSQLIYNLNARDSLFRAIQGVDSVGHFSYLKVNDEIVTYADLVHEVDSVRKDYFRLIRNIEERYPIKVDAQTGACTSETWGLIQSLIMDDRGQISYYVNDGKPVTYADLVNKVDTLQKKCDAEQKVKSQTQQKLSLIQRKYPIIVSECNGVISVSSASIDSALLLLPYYRNKLKRAEDGKSWIVIYPKEI